MRQVARYIGVHASTISKWCKRVRFADIRMQKEIPTKSSRPQTSPIGLATVNRVLQRNNLVKQRSPWKKLHKYAPRPKAVKPGDLVQVDTIHFLKRPFNIQGGRYYVYTLLDVFSRWGYALAAEQANTHQSLEFVCCAKKTAPFSFDCLQSDHGSEFSKYFSQNIKTMHRHSRVRTPNDNAHLERFNRTLKDECLIKLPRDVKMINSALKVYLKYYNEERIHLGLKCQTPSQIINQVLPRC
ncbi:MAG: integrase core domain-containing protein [bacterium]